MAKRKPQPKTLVEKLEEKSYRAGMAHGFGELAGVISVAGAEVARLEAHKESLESSLEDVREDLDQKKASLRGLQRAERVRTE